MSNPHIEMMKQNRFQQKARQTASRAGVQNLGLLAVMAKQGHDIQANAPDPRNDMADLLGKSAQQMTANRPARGWRALVTGLLEGASAGLKGKISQEKKEQAEKVGRVFEWLEANGMAMAEQNRQHELKMQAEEELDPLLKDYSQNMMTMAPLAKEKYAEHILGRLNEITGSDYELSSIDQVNPLKITVKSPKNGNALFVQDFSKRVGGVNADLYQKAVDFENQKFSQEKKIERKMAKNEALISKMPDYSQSLEDGAEESRPNRGRQPQQPGMQPSIQGQQQRTYKVKAPNGAIVLVPESDIDDAISHGGTVVQ